jgi:NodT family efflux transporter outer membrane factor (OMF) lipoprotein
VGRLSSQFVTALLAAAGTIAIGGCTVLGPDHAEPEVAWLEDWQPDLYGQLAESGEESATDLTSWWRIFDDPVLDGLIEQARRENPGLRIAGLRILESRAALGIARSALYPQVQQVEGALSYVNTRRSGGGSDSFSTYDAGLNVGWELDFWGRFQRGVESADAAFFASITNQQDLQVLLTAQVADLYYAYRTTQLRIRIAEENATLQKRSLEITRQLFTKGQTSELDLQQAKTQYLATLSTVPGLEILLTQLRNALTALLARPPGELPELAGTEAALPAVEPVVVEEIPARLVLRRPDIRTAAWQVAAQSAQIGVAEADYYPAISLFGNLGWSGSSIDAAADTATLAAGPAFTWKIFDYGRIRNNVRLQDARLQQAIEAFQNTVLQAAREIDDAAISVVKTREQQGVLTEARVAAQRSLELANKRYQEGYADFQRVLDAQRALFSQAERELVNRGDHLSAIISLYKSLGGGWTPTPVEELVPGSVRETMESRTDWGELIEAPLPVPPENSSSGAGTPP